MKKTAILLMASWLLAGAAAPLGAAGDDFRRSDREWRNGYRGDRGTTYGRFDKRSSRWLQREIRLTERRIVQLERRLHRLQVRSHGRYGTGYRGGLYNRPGRYDREIMQLRRQLEGLRQHLFHLHRYHRH